MPSKADIERMNRKEKETEKANQERALIVAAYDAHRNELLSGSKPENSIEFLIESDHKQLQQDLNLLKQDYKTKFKQDVDENGHLVFSSREEAISFFTAQARLGRSFLLKERGADFYVFSCGDKTLYKGTLADIRRQLETAAKADPTNLQTKSGLDKIRALTPHIKPTESNSELANDSPSSPTRPHS